jgi:hypothetical protein
LAASEAGRGERLSPVGENLRGTQVASRARGFAKKILVGHFGERNIVAEIRNKPAPAWRACRANAKSRSEKNSS